MTRRRWIADEFSNDRAALTGAHAAHLARTLRARVGQDFEVACGGCVRRATVTSVSDDRVEFTLGEELAASAVVPITLLLAVFKFDRMEWAIEKCTELNVTEWAIEKCTELNVTMIIPVIARRTEKHLALAATKRVERWRCIAREASEQSRRASPPEIRDPLKLKEALEQFQDSTFPCHPERAKRVEGPTSCHPERAKRVEGPAFPPADDLRIVLAETEREATLSAILRAQDNLTCLALAIGPEGGWTSEELQLFERSHWLAASLGETILRAETAAIAALAVARAEV
jgi:16S rRNA (uracil1498-N3)-methyltransferase